MSNFIKNIDCPSCGSYMRAAVYKDGGIFCHKCRYTQKGDQMNEEMMDDVAEFAQTIGPQQPTLKTRKINSDTARFYGVMEGTGGAVVFSYAGGKSKCRSADKKFKVVGGRLEGLFGQGLFAKGGKVVVVTEGEFDALAAYQMLSGSVPCVSVPNGASAALKDCQESFEYLDSFDNVVVCFDNDDPGKEATQQVAELFGSKAKVVKFENGYKDANDYLMGNAAAKFVKSFWAAESFRPEGIISVDDVIDRLRNKKELPSIPWCFDSLTKFTHGRRPGEVYTLGAGVGCGKTDFFTQQMAFDISSLQMMAGVIYLEQPVEETAIRVAGKISRKVLHIPGQYAEDEKWNALEACRGKLMMFEHFGSKEWATIEKKIRYMNKAFGITSIYFDHLTALVADAPDERRELDRVLARIASLGQELGLYFHQISHLNTPADGKSHEEGARVRARDFAGSRAIARWSHYMFGMERNTQAEDPVERSTTTFRIVKDRYTGQATGKTFHLRYSPEDGTLYECETPEEKDEVL